MKLADYEERIAEELNKRHMAGITEHLTLLDGFFNLPIFGELEGHFIIGGRTIPVVGAVGDSGRIYFFALKALIKDLEI